MNLRYQECDIQINVDGVTHNGKAYIYPRDYGCIFSCDGYTLSGGLHRPYFVPEPVTFDDAIHFAQQEIPNMHKAIQLFISKKEIIENELSDLKKNFPKEYGEKIQTLREEKKKKKQLLKANLIHQNEYQSIVWEIRDAESNYCSELRTKEEECVTKVFGDIDENVRSYIGKLVHKQILAPTLLKKMWHSFLQDFVHKHILIYKG
ncbi:MAG: hypothetical protein MJZ22_02920 [Candidatus Saccharibacteria bacterium]|nr:hypothetical protein [Candidatus Saccharibacteria bacterium]